MHLKSEYKNFEIILSGTWSQIMYVLSIFIGQQTIKGNSRNLSNLQNKGVFLWDIQVLDHQAKPFFPDEGLVPKHRK